MRLARIADARALYAACASAQAAALGGSHPDVARTEGAMGALSALACDWGGAATAFRACLRAQRERLGPRAAACAVSLHGLACACADAARVPPSTPQLVDLGALLDVAASVLATWEQAAIQPESAEGLARSTGASDGVGDALRRAASALLEMAEAIAAPVFGATHVVLAAMQRHRREFAAPAALRTCDAFSDAPL